MLAHLKKDRHVLQFESFQRLWQILSQRSEMLTARLIQLAILQLKMSIAIFACTSAACKPDPKKCPSKSTTEMPNKRFCTIKEYTHWEKIRNQHKNSHNKGELQSTVDTKSRGLYTFCNPAHFDCDKEQEMTSRTNSSSPPTKLRELAPPIAAHWGSSYFSNAATLVKWEA